MTIWDGFVFGFGLIIGWGAALATIIGALALWVVRSEPPQSLEITDHPVPERTKCAHGYWHSEVCCQCGRL